MTQVLALAILLAAVALALLRPRIGQVQLNPAAAATLGAALMLLTGLVPGDLAIQTLVLLSEPIVTIISLMVITQVSKEAGLLDRVTRTVSRLAAGDGKKLFTWIFFSGTATGMVFTNDAAILIYTPLVYELIEKVSDSSWKQQSKVAYYFAVLYIGNLAGAFVISNPINIIVASFFEIGFLEYAVWMFVPAVVSIVVSYVGLRVAFRKVIPDRYEVGEPEEPPTYDAGFARACSIVLAVTLAGFFAQGMTGVPTWTVAVAGALILLALYMSRGYAPTPIVQRVGWDVIIFVVGMFMIAIGVRNTGLTHELGELIRHLGGQSLMGLQFATALVAGTSSAIMNNHPTADMMIWVIQDFDLPRFQANIMAYSALIGGDLGPKMLPIGSLAAMMWFRMLRDRGVEVSYWQYIRIGIPVTLIAIVLSVLVLHLEVLLATSLGLIDPALLDLPSTNR